jgi:hypothetical protein
MGKLGKRARVHGAERDELLRDARTDGEPVSRSGVKAEKAQQGWLFEGLLPARGRREGQTRGIAELRGCRQPER